MFAITTRLLGYLSGGLGAVALTAGAFGGLQTIRLNETRHTVEVQTAALGRAQVAFNTVVTTANERAEALKARDVLIADQSASIDAISTQRASDRARYLAGIKTADKGAKVHEARAAELVRLPEPAGDRCDAARVLIIQELQNVR